MAIKDLQKVQREFVLNSIYCTDYSEKSGEVDITDSLTEKGKLQYLANAFTTEALNDYNIRKFRGNKTDILADHLQGLPSWLNIPFENYEILKLGKEWGYDLSTEKKEDAFCENYWNLIASKTMQLMNKYDVEIKKYSLDEIEFKRKDNLSEEEALNKIVKQYEDNVFQGLNKEDLEFLGFKKERSLKLGDEYQIEYSKELEDKLKSFGYKKTWGHEGLSDSYAIFEVDNKDHEDYKKVFLSVRDNPILAPTLVNNEGVEERPLRVHKVSQEEHYDTEDKRINEENKETSRKLNRNR